MRWFLVFLIALVVFNQAAVWMRKLGLGRLPGDFTVWWRGRPIYIPLASSLLLSVLISIIGLVM
jgi:Protein of unknown function (DUF2905)